MTNIQFVPGAIDASDCISNAWEMLKRTYGMFLGVSLVAYLLIACVPCLNVFLMGPVMGGVYYVALRDMRGEPVDFGMMFKGFEKFVPLMVVGLIQSIPGIIIQILQYVFQFSSAILDTRRGRGVDYDFFQSSSGSDLAIGTGMMILIGVGAIAIMIFGILWWAATFCAVPLVMEYDLGAIDALKLSAQAGMNNIGGLIVLVIFEGLVMILGLLMICVGMFLISIPIMFLANAFAYRQIFPYVDRQFNMAPPPPNAYGSSFGSGM